MFAPSGYLSLAEIIEIFDGIALSWRNATRHPSDPTPGRHFDPRTGQSNDENWERGEAYRIWLLHRFLNKQEHNLFACALDGLVLKLSRNAVARVREYHGLFHDSPDDWRLIVKSLGKPFHFISCDGYKIDHSIANSHSRGGKIDHPLTMLDGLPVCWKVPMPVDQLDWAEICEIPKEAPLGIGQLSPAGVARAILNVRSGDKKMTKAKIKALVAPSMSVRQFESAWRLAKQEEPGLGRAGRKKS